MAKNTPTCFIQADKCQEATNQSKLYTAAPQSNSQSDVFLTSNNIQLTQLLVLTIILVLAKPALHKLVLQYLPK